MPDQKLKTTTYDLIQSYCWARTELGKGFEKLMCELAIHVITLQSEATEHVHFNDVAICMSLPDPEDALHGVDSEDHRKIMMALIAWNVWHELMRGYVSLKKQRKYPF